MATSGSIDYNQTRNDIIHDALQLIGVYGVGRTVSAEDMAFCVSLLNKMVKGWQAQGIHLWKKNTAYLFPDQYVQDYTLSGATSSAKAANKDDAIITQLNGAQALGNATMTVDTSVGMLAGDVVGVVQTSGAVHWTTISSVGSTTAITLTDVLVEAASDNANVYTFTNRISKPLRMHTMQRVEGVDTNSVTDSVSEIPMIPLSQRDYENLPSKTNSSAVPNHYFFLPGNLTSQVSLWPRPDDGNTYFRFVYDSSIEDFDTITDNPDFPSEWLEVITFQLATRIAPAFGKETKAANYIAPLASSLLENIIYWDNEVVDITFIPDTGN